MSIGVTVVFSVLVLSAVVIMYLLWSAMCLVVAKTSSNPRILQTWISDSHSRLCKILSKTMEFRYSSQSPTFIHSLCAVCLVEFKSGCRIRKLGCEHVFHKNCIDPWLEQKIMCVPKCPICNSALTDEKPPLDVDECILVLL
eukprot:TRINITY_DN2880_c0_g2_i1.p1 TRINITY_DN2880_c0_g2~~TRINITY_DN2880_c0_g2_i1.p1  ORF type:complete len:142 (+),score=7.45 TRINITY_DN2880_c0_g2_i1:639-1064(+)